MTHELVHPMNMSYVKNDASWDEEEDDDVFPANAVVKLFLRQEQELEKVKQELRRLQQQIENKSAVQDTSRSFPIIPIEDAMKLVLAFQKKHKGKSFLPTQLSEELKIDIVCVMDAQDALVKEGALRDLCND
ncbi:hypothetical protein V5T82_10725 [Magnetovibrio sp. PR-2]|uniref:hypothetical protein n=1 Tax=Magnetovibrio sp. PR-2 TaxID=3120356 RepID=UPI002FCE0821